MNSNIKNLCGAQLLQAIPPLSDEQLGWVAETTSDIDAELAWITENVLPGRALNAYRAALATERSRRVRVSQ